VDISTLRTPGLPKSLRQGYELRPVAIKASRHAPSIETARAISSIGLGKPHAATDNASNRHRPARRSLAICANAIGLTPGHLRARDHNSLELRADLKDFGEIKSSENPSLHTTSRTKCLRFENVSRKFGRSFTQSPTMIKRSLSAPGFGCPAATKPTCDRPRLVPASTAVPAAAAKQQNDDYNEEKRGGIHM
jgi:hypothetical protein